MPSTNERAAAYTVPSAEYSLAREHQSRRPAPTPAKKQAARRRTSPSSSFSGRYSRLSYSPRISSSSSGRYSRPSAPPREAPGRIAQVKRPPDLNAFLGADTTYQNQLRQFSKSLADFLADVGQRRGKIKGDYGLSSKALGEQRMKDLESIEQDFAGRGLLKSGLYGGAVGDYEKEYGERLSELSRQQQEALTGLTTEEGQYKSQQELEKQAAKEAAARRRSEKYGI